MLALVLLLAGAAAAPATLSKADETALFTAACGWLDLGGVDAADRTCGKPWENHWTSVRSGRFFQGDGEWLVSLEQFCLGRCRGTTFAAVRASDGWRQIARQDDLVTDDCLTLKGDDGWDRVACLTTEGPRQGSEAHALRIVSFRSSTPSLTLMEKVHGHECELAEPPEKAEFDADRLYDLTAGEAGSDTVLTVQLTVQRAQCDRDTDVPDAQDLGTHLLRFVRSGGNVVPDAPTAVLIDDLGWKPDVP